MSKKSSKSKKKRKFKENIFKEEEIKEYLNKIKKFAISEDDKSRILNLHGFSKTKKYTEKKDCSEEDEIFEENELNTTEDYTQFEYKDTFVDSVIDPKNSDEIETTLQDFKKFQRQEDVEEEKITVHDEKQPDYKTIPVERDFEIDLKRRKLPCCMMEQEIVDLVKNNDIVLITGDTGTGKSTQIPQFLYENGFCLDSMIIGVTQTRRVACIAISKQISLELNSKSLIGYQIRYDKSFNDKNCKIKLMTDGILINELKNDITLSKYSVIIIDEAHERKVNSDILIGLLSQIVKFRRKRYNENNNTIPLKLIIMSATIRKEDFLNNKLFDSIKHLHITSNALNYTVHYNKTTPENYLDETKKKILQIHRMLPPGTILVFLTGKYELYRLKKLLSSRTKTIIKNNQSSSISDRNDNVEVCEDDERFNLEDTEDLEEFDDVNVKEENEEKEFEQLDEERKELDEEEEIEEYELKVLSKNYKKTSDCKWLGSDGSGNLTIKILHASQTNEQQMNCFILPNDNERIVILSTNVAETSITLPNIRYVVDCGKEKRKVYNNLRGYENYEICNISKSSADQRAGRCGRVGHGHCYRLYTNSFFENIFPDYSPVEILETNLCSVVLFLIAMGINPYHFTFLTRPPENNITNSLKILYVLNMVDLKYTGKSFKTDQTSISNDPFKLPANQSKTNLTNMFHPASEVKISKESENIDIRINKLGRCISLIPLEPRYSKMLYSILAKQNLIKDHRRRINFISVSFLIISILSFSGPLFMHVEELKNAEDKNEKGSKNADFRTKFKDDIELYIWLSTNYSKAQDKISFCNTHSVNAKAMNEIFLQSNQLYEVLKLNFKNLYLEIYLENLDSLKVSELRLLSESAIECLVDKIAIGNKYINPEDKTKGYKCQHMGNELVHLPNNYSKFKYECVAYNYLMGDEKVKMYNIIQVNPTHLAAVKSELIISGEIEKSPEPVYENGKVKAYARQYYQPLNYFLTTAKIELSSDHELTYRVFAKAFCFGEVYEQLKVFTHLAKYDKEDFLKPVKTNRALYNLLKVLLQNKVYNKNEFEVKYLKNRSFLLKEYTQMLQDQADSLKVKNIFQSLA